MKKQEKEKNIHIDHRKRVREEFLKSGMEQMPDHKKLEMLLFYAIPRKDTNPIGHELLNKFGSLSGVFDAPIESLMEIDGVSESAAIFLKMIPEISRAYNVDKISSKKSAMDSFEKIGEFLVSKYIGETNEKVYLISLDNKGKIKNCVNVGEGTVDFAQISIRKILEEALKVKASNVIIAHSHPNGRPIPSSADIGTTRNIIRALNTVDIHLINHYIIAENTFFSMASDMKYAPMFI